MPRAPLPVSKVLRAFVDEFEQKIASLSLAESWDNVGVLVETPSAGKLGKLSVLTCIDLTSDVVSEAIDKKCDLILAYHPVLFRPAHSLSMKLQKPILRCVENGINIFSPHTALDTTTGGMNDFIGDIFLPHEESRAGIKPSPIDGFSIGRIINLKNQLSLQDVISLVKSKLSVDRVRYATAMTLTDRNIKSIGICVGSGASVLNGSCSDLYITGEMTHHDILAAKADGKSVILLDHSSSERPFLPTLAEKLSHLQNIQSVSVSEYDVEPIQTE